MRRLRIEFGTVRSLQVQHRAGEADRRELEAEAHTLEGDFVLCGESGRRDLPFDPAVSEAAGHQDAVRISSSLVPCFSRSTDSTQFSFTCTRAAALAWWNASMWLM